CASYSIRGGRAPGGPGAVGTDTRNAPGYDRGPTPGTICRAPGSRSTLCPGGAGDGGGRRYRTVSHVRRSGRGIASVDRRPNRRGRGRAGRAAPAGGGSAACSRYPGSARRAGGNPLASPRATAVVGGSAAAVADVGRTARRRDPAGNDAMK